MRAFFFKGLKKWDIIIFDDIFPNPKSGFRIAEFSFLLSTIKKTKIISNGKAYKYLGDDSKKIKAHYDLLLKEGFSIKRSNKVVFTKKINFININTKIFYCIFLGNISAMLPTLEKNKIPFIFTLYPGGGFALNDSRSDYLLKKVLSSPYFKYVIVNQKTTYDYLISNNFCKKDQINFVFGCLVPQNSINFDITSRSYYPQKKKLDIVFCAGKYSVDGSDKGYPIFISVLKKLYKKYDFINFHVIGGFNRYVIDVEDYLDRIKFYGYVPFNDLAKIYRGIDIIISPNQSNMLGNGSFDGFPLGTLVEAGLNGVLVLSCDPNNENTSIKGENSYFANHKEIIIIKPDADSIVREIDDLVGKPDEIKKIGNEGRLALKKIYNNNYQMKPRIDLLKRFLNEES